MPNPSPLSFPSSKISRRSVLRACALAAGSIALPRFAITRAMAANPPDSQAAAAAATQPPPIHSETIAGQLSLISGAGGNIATLSGEDGVLVIDSGLASVSAGTSAEISKVAPGPLALLVNTHWHFDHAGGNERLARAGARIIAHENCRQRLAVEQHNDFFDKTWPASPAIALPIVTFSTETNIHLNGEDIRLVPVPPAHTDSDVIVRFEKANVVHTGDIFFRGMFPFIDYSSRGWIGGMAAAAKQALAMTDAKTRVIPGHGPLGTQEDLKSYIAFLETVFERLTKLKDAGKTADEAVAALPTRGFDEERSAGLFKPEQFVRFAYAGLLKHG
jgi:glyoxylase-like metal-dependent hydrolase (beta-lactamase superfamily II)